MQGVQPGELKSWASRSDDRTLFVGGLGELAEKVYRLNTATGERHLWKEIGPANCTDTLINIRLLQDGKAHFYAFFRSLSDFYVFRFRGLK